jgi:hypothetical protein
VSFLYYSVHDSQEKFHLHLEWKGNIQLKIMACYVHTNMADTIRLINPNSPFTLSLFFCDSLVFFERKQFCVFFIFVCLYLQCCWRSNHQEGEFGETSNIQLVKKRFTHLYQKHIILYNNNALNKSAYIMKVLKF